MTSPFPGMDPYLEQPTFWSSFHNRLIVAISDAIEVNLSQQYYVEVEVRTYLGEGEESLLVGIPDAIVFSSQADNQPTSDLISSAMTTAVQPLPQQVMLPIPEEVNERYLEVREVATGEVITAIEVLSPKNKRAGKGRAVYEEKRSKVLGSLTHFVELDLLRGGESMPIIGNVPVRAYHILISRSHRRPVADLYRFTIQELMPSFPLPLRKGEPELIVELQEIFNGVYERGRYNSRIDYSRPLAPPVLSEADQEWAEALLALMLQKPE